MAKHNPPTGDRSNFKLFYVEGNFASGDIPTLAQAMMAAVRQPPTVRRIAAPTATENGGDGAREVDSQIDMPLEVDADASVADDTPATNAAKGPPRPRAYRKPKLVEGLDVEGDGKSFKAFAEEKKPDSHRAKYLVAATWLHNHGNPKLEAITVDHVWTCYQAADWTFDVQDPGFIFRQLKSQGRGTIKDKKFAINQIGLAEVKEMKPASA
jgi:hypothetical protein